MPPAQMQQRPPPQHYPHTPVPQQPPQSQTQLAQEAMIQQVLAMDQRTIDTFPENERNQIMAIRAQMGVR
jgi:hypothetical protein